jgi:signal transduction histidine kinase/ActR/RegA family two-component response regulator
MKPFRDQPIARKALTLGLAPTLCSLLLVSIASMTATYFTARGNTARDVDAQAAIVADSAGSALAFDDRASATETLSLLRGRPNIDAACVFDASGSLFASYPQGDDRCDRLLTATARGSSGSIVVARPVTANGRHLGSVVLAGNLSLLYAWMRIQAFVILGALLGGTLVALSLTRLLQRSISRPVLDLAATADRVSTRRDYALRATQTTGDEVGGLVQSFNGMLDELQRQNQALTVEIAERKRAEFLKDEFLAAVSHELRTPLNAILGWLQILRTTGGGEARLGRALESLERNARSQARVIEDLLDVSRMVTGKLQIKMDVVDLRSVLAAAVDSVRPTATAKSLQLALDLPALPCLASADPDRLQQVVWNLLSNAVKFTPQAGVIDVSLSASGQDFVLSVRDTGIGITPDFLPFVFDHFRQADGSMTRQHGGLGLGLAIVKEVTERHNGSVTATSAGSGRGATFTVRLPQLVNLGSAAMPIAANAPGRPAPRDHHRWSGIRILAVDDDPDSLEVVRAALTLAGADVTTASSASAAIRAWELNPSDVLLCDLAMPDMDGFQVLSRIRGLDAMADRMTAAIALTAHTSDETQTRCLSAGFHAHVGKPYQLDDLTTALSGALAQVRARRPAPRAADRAAGHP